MQWTRGAEVEAFHPIERCWKSAIIRERLEQERYKVTFIADEQLVTFQFLFLLYFQLSFIILNICF